MTAPINVGLVGYGLAGKVFHAPLISSVPQLRLSSVVTSRRDEVAADLPKAAVVRTVDELLSDGNIGIVVVAAPSGAHFEIAAAALRAGKHVVVDKPIAVHAKEAEALITSAKERKLLLTVFQNRRWDGDFLTVKQCIPRLGQLYYYESHFDRFRPQIKPGWREETGRGSGLLYDLGSHLIDQALQLFGMPRAVTATLLAQRPAAKAVDYFHLVLDYGATQAILHASTVAAAPGPRFALNGDRGSFVKYGLDPQEPQLKQGLRPGDPNWGADSPELFGEMTHADGRREKIPTLTGCYEQFYQQLVDALESGGPVPVSAEDARDGLIVLEAAQRSAEERKTVTL